MHYSSCFTCPLLPCNASQSARTTGGVSHGRLTFCCPCNSRFGFDALGLPSGKREENVQYQRIRTIPSSINAIFLPSLYALLQPLIFVTERSNRLRIRTNTCFLPLRPTVTDVSPAAPPRNPRKLFELPLNECGKSMQYSSPSNILCFSLRAL